MPRPLPFTDDELRAAVSDSPTLREVCRRLNLMPGGKTYRSLRQRAALLDIDTSHLATELPAPSQRRALTDDELAEAVLCSRSIAEVLRRLGYVPSGGMYRWIKAKCRVLGIDMSHFTGQSWAAGLTNPPGGVRRRPLEDILVAGSLYSSASLRRRLIAAGLKPAHCEICGLASWLDAELPLALDHISGDPTDNRIENLRILCPNCHAQTATWCGRNRGH